MNRHKINLLKERVLALQTKLDNIEIRLAVLLANKNDKNL
jgi:hypothetical protein